MKHHRIRIRFSLIVVILFLMGCTAPIATPAFIASTATLLPATASPTFKPIDTPTDLATPTLAPNASPKACKLPEAAHHTDVGLGFPRYATRMASTGTVRAKVLFVDFSDASATETPQQVFSRISPGASDFFEAVSYHHMSLELEPYFVWLRMSKPSADYMFERGFSFDLHHAYIQEAVTLADADVDFSNADTVYVMANPQAGAVSFGPAFTPSDKSFGITVDGNTITNGATSGFDIKDWGFLWLNHEAGHTLGLVDLYAFENDTDNYDNIHRFVGNFSLMGYIAGKAPEPLAYERWLLDWLDDNQIVCQQTSDETVTLSAIEEEGNVKAVIVPTGPTTALMVESRRALGYDAQLVKPGALVYSIDTSLGSGAGPIKIFPALDNDPYRDKSPLAAGESVTVGNITVTVIAATANSDTVQVTIIK